MSPSIVESLSLSIVELMFVVVVVVNNGAQHHGQWGSSWSEDRSWRKIGGRSECMYHSGRKIGAIRERAGEFMFPPIFGGSCKGVIDTRLGVVPPISIVDLACIRIRAHQLLIDVALPIKSTDMASDIPLLVACRLSSASYRCHLPNRKGQYHSNPVRLR